MLCKENHMKLSTKGRYASRAMLELAEAYGKGPVKLRSIAGRQENSSTGYNFQVFDNWYLGSEIQLMSEK